MNEIERCLLVKQEVFVYKIPPRQSARGYRAADWSLTSPDWTGRLRIMEANKKVRVSRLLSSSRLGQMVSFRIDSRILRPVL